MVHLLAKLLDSIKVFTQTLITKSGLIQSILFYELNNIFRKFKYFQKPCSENLLLL
jgi:hypothetical protein